ISCGFIPSPTDSDPWGSKSTSSTLRPYSASAAPRLMVVVVLPTPPFWLHIEMTRALPWMLIGRGSGRTGIGRPVGPITGSGSTDGAGVTGAARSSSGAGAGAATCSSSCCSTGRRNGIGSLAPPASPAACRFAEDAPATGTRGIGGISQALVPKGPEPNAFTRAPSVWASLRDSRLLGPSRATRRLYGFLLGSDNRIAAPPYAPSKSGDSVCTAQARRAHELPSCGELWGRRRLSRARADGLSRRPRGGCRR